MKMCSGDETALQLPFTDRQTTEIVKNCNDKVVWLACDAAALEKAMPNGPTQQR